MISAGALKEVPQEGAEWEWAERVKAQLAQLRRLRKPFYLTLGELEPVLRYKLRGQYGRTRARRQPLTDGLVSVVTRAAFEVCSSDRLLTLRVRIGILSSLPGIGIPVASAVLALAEPEEYGIIDIRAWEQVFGMPKKTFNDTDYARYMAEVWRLATELGWPAQRVDWCLWRLPRPGAS